MRLLKLAAQFIFYALVLAILLSRSTSTSISHDENQFIAPGQMFAAHGLLPYVDYPYTHVPYSILFYALTASFSNYDFLAGRIMGSIIWLLCIFAMVAITRIMRGRRASSSPNGLPFADLLWEFVLVFVLIYHPRASYVLAVALNHSFATLFSLLALLAFVAAIQAKEFSYRGAVISGLFISLAAFTRLNYASLIVVLVVCWMIYSLALAASPPMKTLFAHLAGVLAGSLPVLILAALAPAQFYYGNLVYIRLNTIYYEGLLRRYGMDLSSKIAAFARSVMHQPIDILLYAVLFYVAVSSLIRLVRSRSPHELARFAAAGFAAALLVTAFAPTPALSHYFFAPLPFLFILVGCVAADICRFGRPVHIASALVVLVALLAGVRLPDPIRQLTGLSDPSRWPPVQIHAFAQDLKRYVPRGGRVLTLLPMIPLEAGCDAYLFTATGPFSWRTSLLLTPARRAQYGVTSPEELPALLSQLTPDGILTGFEAPNAGFERQDLGGLETPFSDYAVQHGYTRVDLHPSFTGRTIILWVRLH